MTEIEIEIDGKKLTAKPNQTVIQVADEAGIYIPRFCYHKHLTIPANCRMCLVEVEKAPKVLPACATPVMPGMKVFTKSERTVAAQRAVMEFLLVNHPLDCPICDQGGECELQDLSMGYGASWSHYDEAKRSVADQDLGPLIATDMTRCIYCTRCVRFGEEHAGLRELGLIGRGEFTEVSTYIQHVVNSEISGNIIDLCPVGALTSKPYRFTSRPWELDQAPSISPHDCLGTNINVHTRYGKVMRVVSRENNEINETWITDRDRFSYTALYHEDRLAEPLAKINGTWQPVDWQQALYLAAKGLQEIVRQEPTQLGALASSSATVEELYLLQKITRALGSNNIDCRLQEVDGRDQDHLPLFPGMTLSLNELETCDAVLLIGSDVQQEQPLVAVRLRKAVNRGATIAAINAYDYRFSFEVSAKGIVQPAKIPSLLADLLAALQKSQTSAENKGIGNLLGALQNKKQIAVLLGAQAWHHPQASLIRYLAQEIAKHTGASVSYLTSGANLAGGWLAGAVPHRLAGGKPAEQVGQSTLEMLKAKLSAYLLLNVEPDLDCANVGLAVEAMARAKHVVALSMYKHELLMQHANVILPIGSFMETAGTYVNCLGKWQSFQGVAKPFGQSRPAWKVLRALANFLNCEGFDYEQSTQIRDELKAQGMQELTKTTLPKPLTVVDRNDLSRVGEIPLYAVDPMVRRAVPLQTIQKLMLDSANASPDQASYDLTQARIHPKTATRFQIADGDQVMVEQASFKKEVTMRLDPAVALDAVYLPGGLPEVVLGDLFGAISIAKR